MRVRAPYRFNGKSFASCVRYCGATVGNEGSKRETETREEGSAVQGLRAPSRGWIGKGNGSTALQGWPHTASSASGRTIPHIRRTPATSQRGEGRPPPPPGHRSLLRPPAERAAQLPKYRSILVEKVFTRFWKICEGGWCAWPQRRQHRNCGCGRRVANRSNRLSLIHAFPKPTPRAVVSLCKCCGRYRDRRPCFGDRR